MLKYALMALAATMTVGSAQATVITFDTDVQINPFTGTYTQNGYNVTYVSGALRLLNNNPVYGDVFAASNAAGGSFNLSRIDGGQFSIQSFLGGAGLAGTSLTYSLLGYLAGANTYSQTLTGTNASGSVAIPFTPTPTANLFDRINFSISSSQSTALVDNINVTNIDAPAPTPTPDPVPPVGAVPEPATWAMMILGFGLIGFAMRRRQQNVIVRFA